MFIGLGVGMAIAAGEAVPDQVIAMLAHRVYGAGYNSGAAPLTGDGTQKTYAANFVNDSGAAIEVASIVVQRWTLRTTGTTDASAPYATTGTVEYPIGTQVGSFSIDATPGDNVASPEVTLSASIPAGGTFRVSLAATPANGATYIANLGFAGLRNHALRSTLKKVCVAGFGDSIMTNNNGALYNAALGRCPAYLNSITGTTAATYGASSAANFAKQVSLSALLGCTHILSNFGTNDFGASTALATLQGYLTAMRDAARAASMKFAQATMLPRTKTTNTAVTASSVTSSGTTMTLTVPDASKFTAGVAYSVAGATQTEYNGTKLCTAVNVGSNTIDLLFVGSATTPATGTITVVPWKVTLVAGFMETFSSFYAAGTESPRGQFNAWVRSGAFDDYVELADACEPSRDSGRWLVAGEDALLPTTQLVTISSVISTSRFNSNYDRGSSTVANGVVQPLTGANAGVLKGGSNNTGGDVTVVSAYTNTQQIGDTVYVMPGVCYMSDDGVHPRVAGGGKGGQPHLDNALASWLDAKAA